MDIVERLRFIHRRVDISGAWFDADVAGPIIHEAADEIERLRKRVTVLEDALALQVNTEFGKCPP